MQKLEEELQVMQRKLDKESCEGAKLADRAAQVSAYNCMYLCACLVLR